MELKKIKSKYLLIYTDLIKYIGRPGFKEFIKDYEEAYKLCPASSKYHLNCEYGLLIHSVNVYLKFKQRLKELKDDSLTEEEIIVISLFHDVCKVGKYIKTTNEYIINKSHPEGHSKLSVKILEKYMKLTDNEREIITYHMGIFGITDKFCREYDAHTLKNAINKNYLVNVFASCDFESSREELRFIL